MTDSATVALRDAINALRDAIDAYGALADYVSTYPQYGWMELDACHSILFRRREDLLSEVNNFVEASGDAEAFMEELILLQMSVDDAFCAR